MQDVEKGPFDFACGLAREGARLDALGWVGEISDLFELLQDENALTGLATDHLVRTSRAMLACKQDDTKRDDPNGFCDDSTFSR